MKHENIFIVAVSYIIGFITAYIAFGVNHSDYQEPLEQKQVNIEKSESVEMKKKPQQQASQKMIGVETQIKSDGLYALIGDDERILSAQVISATTPGYHYAIPKTEVSPDGKFIFYCAQASADNNSCANFIYEIDKDLVYLIKDSKKEQVMTQIDMVEKSTWSIDGLLVLPSHKSANADKPWQVI